MRLWQKLAIPLIAALLGASLFGLPANSVANAHAAMSHTDLSMHDCTEVCAANHNPDTTNTTAAVLNHEEQQEGERERDILPGEPHYLCFTHAQMPQKLTAQAANLADLLRPPDLIKLYTNYRN